MRETIRWIVLGSAVAVLVAATGTGCLVGGQVPAAPSQSTPEATPAPEPSKVISVAHSVAPFSENGYVPTSKLIVLGTVTGFLPAVWEDNKEFIYTPVVVAVERVVKGSAPGKEVTVYQLGGTVGTVGMVTSDAASLQQGKRYLLFLAPIPRQKSEKLTTNGAYMGAVWVEGDSAFPVRRGETKPEPLGQLIANIEAAMRGEFHPTPTPTWAPPPTQIPSGGLYPPKPPRPVQPGE